MSRQHFELKSEIARVQFLSAHASDTYAWQRVANMTPREWEAAMTLLLLSLSNIEVPPPLHRKKEPPILRLSLKTYL